MKHSILIITVFIAFSFTSIINAQEDEKKLQLYGDFRFRTEHDRNSIKSDGTEREDRDRLRYRLRFGFTYALNDNIEFGGRIRSGNRLNQQSPHVTLGKEFHSDEFSIDKAFILAKTSKGLWAWAGKNSNPFWGQNELLWNSDINPEGIALGSKFKLTETTSLEPVLGYFIGGHSGKKYKDDSSISIVQLKLNSKVSSHKLILSTGLINSNDIPNTPDDTHTFLMNYNIWATSVQLIVQKPGLVFGIDYFENLSDYNDNSNINAVFKDQTTAYVGSLIYKIKKFQFGYYYAHIEKYAVVDYLAQDDWLRWGNINFTRSSNFRGHEFRIKYSFNNQFNTVLRTYVVKGIETSETNLETGTRVRLDLNIKF